MGKQIKLPRVNGENLDNTLLAANEDGITIVSTPFTLGLPKSIAIKYAQKGISEKNTDGFVRTEHGVVLVHGDVRLQLTETEADVVVDVIKTEF